MPERTAALPRAVQSGNLFQVPKVSRVAQYIYQKVIRRKPVPYQPSPKHPEYMLCFVEEELECGHTVTIHPHQNERLVARTRNCHECSGWFGGLKLPKKPTESVKKTVRSLKQSGYASGPVLGFACLCFVGFTCLSLWLAKHQTANTYRYAAPTDRFQILKRFPGGLNYQLRWIHSENGVTSTRFIHAHFCEGYIPPFSAGETLSYLAYQDVGSCWFIQGNTLGYDFELGPDGHDSLAPNCHEGSKGYVECEPVINEAIFPEEK